MCSIERRVFSLACSLQLNWQFSLFSVFWASCRLTKTAISPHFYFSIFLSFSSFFSPLLFYDRFSTEAHTRNFRPAFTSNSYENVVYRKAPKQGLFCGNLFSLHDVMKKVWTDFEEYSTRCSFSCLSNWNSYHFIFLRQKKKELGKRYVQ